MSAVETPRLRFRHITNDDASFIFELYNTAAFKRFIGDKNFQTVADASQFIASSLVKMYQTEGLGLHLVELKPESRPIGICGLIKRESLEEVDLGFGYLPDYEGLGYGCEAARSFIDFAGKTLRLLRIVAITTSDNTSCLALLAKLGFQFERVHEELSDQLTLGLYGLRLHPPQD